MKSENIKEGIVSGIIILLLEISANYLKIKIGEQNMITEFSIWKAIIEALPISIFLGVFLSFVYSKIKTRLDTHDTIVGKKAGNEDVIWYVLDYRTKKLRANQVFTEEEEKMAVKKILEKNFGSFMLANEINEIMGRFYK